MTWTDLSAIPDEAGSEWGTNGSRCRRSADCQFLYHAWSIQSSDTYDTVTSLSTIYRGQKKTRCGRACLEKSICQMFLGFVRKLALSCPLTSPPCRISPCTAIYGTNDLTNSFVQGSDLNVGLVDLCRPRDSRCAEKASPGSAAQREHIVSTLCIKGVIKLRSEWNYYNSQVL